MVLLSRDGGIRTLANPATGVVALLTRRVMTGEHVGQAVPGGVAGRLTLSLAGVPGRLASFQSIGWVPGDNLAYVDVLVAGFARIQMFEMVGSEFWRIRLRVWWPC